jgi:hypothetical protein
MAAIAIVQPGAAQRPESAKYPPKCRKCASMDVQHIERRFSGRSDREPLKPFFYCDRCYRLMIGGGKPRAR